MQNTPLSDEDFIDLFTSLGSGAMSRHIGVTERTILRRRRVLEGKLGHPLNSPGAPGAHARQERTIQDGNVVVFSDCHYWPGDPPVMHSILLKVIKKLKPVLVIANGDICDFASISRFDPLGWEDRPTVEEELITCQMRMEEIRDAAGSADLIWTAGNHDMRFEMAFAKHLPDMRKVKGLHLKDHFPHWPTAWSVWINNDVVVKHRIKGGQNALKANIAATRKHCVTGHLHSANVVANSAYENDTLYGMDAGTIADTYGPQFLYCEDNPRDWRSAFGVLTFHQGKLLRPELCQKLGPDSAEFRGEVWRR